MAIFTSSQTLATTPFSEFIRGASSGEKKRVYSNVLKKATQKQQEQVARVRVLLDKAEL